MEAFLARAGKVAAERSHSVEDLLKFMERGDLPIAEDGSILIYKVLKKRAGKYYDCHTGKVPQHVGAYVYMDASLVDHNRNNECSNGLHVARRGYIKSFSGDVCTLCKVAPEDVIAVPSYDANKMRVCGYHIIFELTPAQYGLVRQNKPMSDDPQGAITLAEAIAGQHTGITHKVKIGAHSGGDVSVTDVDVPTPAAKPEKAVEPVKALQNPDKKHLDAPIDPKTVTKTVAKAPKQAKAPIAINGVNVKPGSSRERIQKLLAVGITSVGVAQAILKLKKDAKKGWSALGVSDEQVKEIVRLAGNQS